MRLSMTLIEVQPGEPFNDIFRSVGRYASVPTPLRDVGSRLHHATSVKEVPGEKN
jgi:hypothetical protein